MGHTVSGLPLVLGQPQVGQSLVVDVSQIADTDGIRAVSYSWLANGVQVPGMDSFLLQLDPIYLGQTITAVVTMADNLGNRSELSVEVGTPVEASVRELVVQTQTPADLIFPTAPEWIARLADSSFVAAFTDGGALTLVHFDAEARTELSRLETTGQDGVRASGAFGSTAYQIFVETIVPYETQEVFLRSFSITEDGIVESGTISLGTQTYAEPGVSTHEIRVEHPSDDNLLVMFSGAARMLESGDDGSVRLIDTFALETSGYYGGFKTHVTPLGEGYYLFAHRTYFYAGDNPNFAEVRNITGDVIIPIDLGEQIAIRGGSSGDLDRIELMTGADGNLYFDIPKAVDYYPQVQRIGLDPETFAQIGGRQVAPTEGPVNDPTADYTSDPHFVQTGTYIEPVFVETGDGRYQLIAQTLVPNRAPQGELLLTGTAEEGNTLLASAEGLADADGIGTISYIWLRDGQIVDGATSDSYLLTQADAGARISVMLRYQDSEGRAEYLVSTLTDEVLPGNFLPEGEPVIVATAAEAVLKVDVSSLSDRDGLGSLEFQWFRDGAPISGAINDTYRLQGGDSGHQLTVEVGYTDGRGNETQLTSIPLGIRSGGSAADILTGASGRDALVGLGGNDVLKGLGGGDLLIGGSGNDIHYGENLKPAFVTEASAQVFRLYQAAFDRAPDAAGHMGWTAAIVEGRLTAGGVAKGFIGSAEFQTIYGTPNDAGFVNLLYLNVLGRAADAAGRQYWLDALAGGASRAQVLLGFSDSQEFQNATRQDAAEWSAANTDSIWSDEVFRLYHATLGRDPDLAGFVGWTTLLGTEMSLLTAIGGFTGSQEFQDAYGTLDDTDFVRLLYQNVLDREADAAGLAGWLSLLDGGATRAQVVEGFVQSAEFIAASAAPLVAWMRGHGTDDMLDGGAGNNMLLGGMMSDSFVFDASQGGTHQVLDLEPWDSLDFRGFGYDTAADIRAHMTQTGDDVVFWDQGVRVIFLSSNLAGISNEMLF